MSFDKDDPREAPASDDRMQPVTDPNQVSDKTADKEKDSGFRYDDWAAI